MNSVGVLSGLPSMAQPSAGAGAPAPQKANSLNQPLSKDEQAQVAKLKARDTQVRAHEQAHKNVGGEYAGAISYEYQKGPDGRSYAVGGEVPIDASEIAGDPEATIEKMRIVKAAALAPAEPSAQDRKVAALADAQMMKAQAELNTQRTEGAAPNSPESMLSGDLNQKLAEMRETAREEQEAGAANQAQGVAAPFDLMAYAQGVYASTTPATPANPL